MKVKKVDFNDLEARNAHQRARDEEKKRKMDNIWKERVRKVRNEVEENRPEIEICQTQIRNCFRLLLPDPASDDFEPEKTSEKEEEDLEFKHIFEEDGSVAPSSSREHGIASTSSGISVKIEEDAKVEIENDNETVVENLRDQFVLLTNRFLPLIKKWTITLTKGRFLDLAIVNCFLNNALWYFFSRRELSIRPSQIDHRSKANLGRVGD